MSHLPGDPSFRFSDCACGGYEAGFFFASFIVRVGVLAATLLRRQQKSILSTSKLHAYAPAVTM